MRKIKVCKCKEGCTAEVKGDDKKYARGHHPSSSVMGMDRREAISRGRKRYFKRGGKSWWEGKKHSDETKKKMRVYARNRTSEHRERLRIVNHEKTPKWKKNLIEAVKLNNKLNPPRLGTEQSYVCRRKISRTRKRRIKSGQIKIWNKGKVGAQIGWAKGLTKETDSRVKKISDRLIGHPFFFSRYQCWYPSELDKKQCMRSTWEVAFALWLDANKIRWQYEPKSFYVGGGNWRGLTYTPDFLLVDQNEYVEVKGWLSSSNKRKLNKFKTMYPDITLHILNGHHLNAAGIIKWRSKKEVA